MQSGPPLSAVPSAEAFAQMREQRDRLLAILDAGTAVIYYKDAAGRYQFINRRFEELFHVTRQEIVGRTDHDLFPAAHASIFRANDLKVLETGQALELEELAPHDDGPHIYLSLKFPLRDAGGAILGVCGVSSDITRFKKIEEDRNLFFHVTRDLLCTADFEGRFIFVNPSWERTLGWSREQLTSRPYIDFVHPEDREATMAESAKLRDSDYETVSFENRYRCADGSFRWLLWTARPLWHRKLVFAAARDITPRKLAERELSQRADELRQALEQAQRLTEELERTAAGERLAHTQLKHATVRLIHTEKLVALGQMTAGIAHEINNPLALVFNNLAVLERDLNGLRGLLEAYQEAEALLGKDHLEAFQAARAQAEEIDAAYTLGNLEGLLGRSRDGLKRIQQIVHDLRIISRGGERDWHQVDLNQGIGSVLNLLRIRAARRKVQIETALEPLPELQCHPGRLHQVVINLLHNAIDASPEGGTVRLGTRAVDGHIEIHVADEGPGIPPELQNKIFDPFFTTKPPGQGTGLGLSTCQAIVEEHGGRIELVPGEAQAGAHFVVHLPLRPAPLRA